MRRDRKIYRRRRSYKINKSYKTIIIILIGLFILSGASYVLFFRPSNIECGIVMDRKETGNSISLKLGYRNKVKWVNIKKKNNVPESAAYNVTLRGIRSISITPCKIYTGKVLSRDSQKIMLDTAELNLNPKVSYYMKEDDKLVPSSQSKIIVGYSTYRFAVDSKGNVGAAILEKPTIQNVRVGISNNGFTSLEHKEALVFKTHYNNKYYSKKSIAEKGLQVLSKDINLTVPRDTCLEISYSNDTINLSLLEDKIKNEGKGEPTVYETRTPLGSTKDRVFIAPLSEDPTDVLSLLRIDQKPREYYGTFEVFAKDGSLRLINDVDIEQYLRFVVPSEMVPSGGTEGFKVQAVAARTYVLSDMLSGRFAKSGFHVDDTQLSQAYNAQGNRVDSDEAIAATKGQVLTYEGKVIDAKYYSTSPGVGAPFNEVWYNDKDYLKKNTEPYLTFKDYTGTGIKSLANEDVALNFFKDWTINAYDSNAQLFRWKFSMDKKLLNDTINKRIAEKFKEPSVNLEKKWYFNIYRKAPVPSNGIGNIEDLSISKRGQAGNVMEMTIVTDTGTYKVSKGANIKYLIRPEGEKYKVTPLFGKEITNPGLIYSEFFVFDKVLSGTKIKSLTVYGGGFGHGAGISQYGIVGLVSKEKKNYQEVLETFYEGVKLEDYKTVVNNSL